MVKTPKDYRGEKVLDALHHIVLSGKPIPYDTLDGLYDEPHLTDDFQTLQRLGIVSLTITIANGKAIPVWAINDEAKAKSVIKLLRGGTYE
ncbi:MAG: hypothetical protein LBB59_02950 [Campylobacteraceae bacterium]|jgi:hypothetical protein|nr:hypothetical protein [Campylobacteraceae bacterium]